MTLTVNQKTMTILGIPDTDLIYIYPDGQTLINLK